MRVQGGARNPLSRQRSAPSGAIYSPHKQVADLRRLGVKGHCPLRVQGGARNPLSRSDQRHKAHSIPTISKTKFCASLPSGNPRRQAYPFPNKQTAGLRPTAPAVKRGFAANHSRNKQVTDLPSHSPQSKTKFCAIRVKRRCLLRAWAAPTNKTIAVRQSNADRRTPSQTSKPQVCALPRRRSNAALPRNPSRIKQAGLRHHCRQAIERSPLPCPRQTALSFCNFLAAAAASRTSSSAKSAPSSSSFSCFL